MWLLFVLLALLSSDLEALSGHDIEKKELGKK
jgi:hypothetical protein